MPAVPKRVIGTTRFPGIQRNLTESLKKIREERSIVPDLPKQKRPLVAALPLALHHVLCAQSLPELGSPSRSGWTRVLMARSPERVEQIAEATWFRDAVAEEQSRIRELASETRVIE